MAVTAISNRKYQKQKPTKLSVGAKIHNRFDFYINDKPVAYGESKYQVGMGENIVLNQMYTRLCARSSYFVNIHFGTGTGTLSAARTSLFTHLGTKTAVNDAQSKAWPTSYWRQKIVLNPEEYVGSALSEVGVAFGATSTNLVTHALIKDINGNPITLTKTALDVVTIYATVYVTFSTSATEIQLNSLNYNPLINYLVGGTEFPNLYFTAGQNGAIGDNNCNGLLSSGLGNTSAVTLTTDVVNKKFYTEVKRFGISEVNGHIREFVLRSNTIANGLVRLVLPSPTKYSGLTLSNVSIGAGDGLTSIFTLPSKYIDLSSLIIKLDGIETTTYSNSLGNRELNFPAYSWFPSVLNVGQRGLHSFNTTGDIVWVFAASNSQLYYSLLRYKKVNDAFKLTHIVKNNDIVLQYGIAGFSSDAKVVCVTSSYSPYLRIWREVDEVVSEDLNIPPCGTGGARCVATNLDGTCIAMGYVTSTPQIRVFDKVDNVWIQRSTTGLTLSPVDRIQLSNNGLILACYYNSGSTYIYKWNGSSWASLGNVSGNYLGLGMSADGSRFAHNALGGSTVNIYNINESSISLDGALTFTKLSYEYFASILMSADGNSLWCGTKNGYIEGLIGERIDGVWQTTVSRTSNLGGISDGSDLPGVGYFYPEHYLIDNGNNQGFSFYDIKKRTHKIAFSTPPGLVTSEAVGTGDGSTTIFNLDHTPIAGSLTMKLDGVETTDYTTNGAQITFNTAPGSGVAITADYRYECTITADYTVNGIHKTAQRVIDLYAEITFGEAT